MTRALFIGRFQPFHTGHLSVLRALEQAGYAEVIIGIGSAQYDHLPDNPFSFAERQEMIATVLRASGFSIPYYIVAIPDIHDDARWVHHVNQLVQQAAGNYDVVFTGNDWVKNLYDKNLLETPRDNVSVQPVEKVVIIEATSIRAMICSGDVRWKSYVHPCIQATTQQRVLEISKM